MGREYCYEKLRFESSRATAEQSQFVVIFALNVLIEILHTGNTGVP